MTPSFPTNGVSGLAGAVHEALHRQLCVRDTLSEESLGGGQQMGFVLLGVLGVPLPSSHHYRYLLSPFSAVR
jgi:hypothetical protein